MNSRSIDCLCIGIVVADHVCDPVHHMPKPGELVTTDSLRLTIGGCAANAAVDLARLGLQVSIAGIVGKDIFGRFAQEFLEEAGVDCEHLQESPTLQTSGTLIINVQNEDRRFFHAIGANAEFTTDRTPASLLAKCRVLNLGGYCLSNQPSSDSVAKCFAAAQDAGTTTVLDVVIPDDEEYWSRIEPVLPLTDVFMPNSDEAQMITGLVDPLDQAQFFRDAGAKNVVITCGGDGAILQNDNVRMKAGVYKVDFVDGTGSGDAFLAGYIYGLLAQEPPEQCLRMGTALGASCVRRTGATTGVFNAGELREFVESHSLAIEQI